MSCHVFVKIKYSKRIFFSSCYYKIQSRATIFKRHLKSINICNRWRFISLHFIKSTRKIMIMFLYAHHFFQICYVIHKSHTISVLEFTKMIYGYKYHEYHNISTKRCIFKTFSYKYTYHILAHHNIPI